MKLRILVADDHNLVRQAIIDLIDSCPDFSVVAEADDGNSLVEKFLKYKPDVVLSDISMPRMTGLEAVKTLLEKAPDAKVIFLSMFTNDEYIYKSVKVGAKGLIGKDILKGELVEAIKTVASGERYFPLKTERELFDLVLQFDEMNTDYAKQQFEQLDHREKKVLKLLSEGLTSEEIGEKLFISTKTVSKIRSTIMEKLMLKSYHHLIRFAVEYFYNNEKDII